MDALPLRQGPTVEAVAAHGAGWPWTFPRTNSHPSTRSSRSAAGHRPLILGGRANNLAGRPIDGCDTDRTSPPPAGRRGHRVMGVVTVTAVVGAAWVRYGPGSSRQRPEVTDVSVGDVAPPLRLLDLKTSEPIVLIGLDDRVVWLVFWSAGSPTGRACLPELEAAWKGLRAHRRFAPVSAAVEAEDPAVVRAAVAAGGVDLPVYLAGPETRRQFHAQTADPPLHVVIDAGGQVLTMARHAGQATIDRIVKQVRRRLDELDPIGETRFAASE